MVSAVLVGAAEFRWRILVPSTCISNYKKVSVSYLLLTINYILNYRQTDRQKSFA